MRMRIVGWGFPGTELGGLTGVRVGVQHGSQVQAPAAGDGDRVVFDLAVGVVDAPDGRDFRGPYVHGRRHERFIYLVWTHRGPDGQPVVFRRAKLMLAPVAELDLSGCLIGARMILGSVGLTGGDGGPLCAAVRPPAIRWETADAPPDDARPI